MNAEIIIGLISLGVLIIINIVIAAVSYGKLIKGQEALDKRLDEHCNANEKAFEQVDKRFERVEKRIFKET